MRILRCSADRTLINLELGLEEMEVGKKNPQVLQGFFGTEERKNVAGVDVVLRHLAAIDGLEKNVSLDQAHLRESAEVVQHWVRGVLDLLERLAPAIEAIRDGACPCL